MPWSNTWNFVDPSGTTTRSKTINSDGTFTETTTTVFNPRTAGLDTCVSSSECASGFACINGRCEQQSTAGSTDGGSAGCGLEDNGDGGGGGGCAGGGCTEPSCDNTECDCDTSSTRTCRTDENGDIVCECVPDDEEGKPCSKFCTNQWLSFGVYRSPCTPVNTCSECSDCILAVGGDVPRCSRKASSPTLPCQCDQDLTGDANPSSTNLECKQCTNSGAYINDPNCSFEVTCTRNCACGPIEQTIPVPSTILAQVRQQYCLNRLRCPSIAEIDPDNCDPEGPIDETCDTANGDYVTSYDPAGPGNNIRIRCGAVWCNSKDCNCYTRITPDESGVYCTQWTGGTLEIGKDEITAEGIFFTAPGTISSTGEINLSIFKVGDRIVVSSGSGLNDGVYVVSTSSKNSLSVTAVGGGSAGIQTETAAAAGRVTIRRVFDSTSGNDISFPSSNVMKSVSDRFCDLKAGDVINIKTTSGVNDGSYTVKSATCTEVVITGHRFTTQAAIQAGTTTVSKVGEIGVTTKDPNDGKTYCWKERRVGYPERTSGDCPNSGEENPDSKDSCDPTSDAYVCKNKEIQTFTSSGICPDEGIGSFPCPAGKQCINDTCINNSLASTYTMKVRICDADSGCPTAVECNCHADCGDCQLCGGVGADGGTCVQNPACLEAQQKWVTFKVDYTNEVETVCCLNSCGCPAGTNPVSEIGYATYQYWVKQVYFDIAYNVNPTDGGVGYLNAIYYDNSCLSVQAKEIGLDEMTRAMISVSGDLDTQANRDKLNKYSTVEHWLYGGSATRVISAYSSSATLTSCDPSGNANCSRGPCGTLSSIEGGQRRTWSNIYDVEIVDANPGENPPSDQTTPGTWPG